MHSERARIRARVALATILPLCTAAPHAQGPDVDFNRDVRPILADRCFRCHGPDAAARKGDLRLDLRDTATTALPSGVTAIRPGEPAHSALIARITTTDRGERMPPPSAGPALTADEQDVLRRWIAQGAGYARHWAFAPPEPAAPPPVSDPSWPRNALDHFVMARLDRAGLRPSPEAERRVLARRVALDVTGLPPTPEEVDAMVADPRPDAYERFVDRLLASTAYGEHQARAWLDLARYADSAGYAQDPPRNIWRYRDWVIDAFNDNVPFDRFTILQLAGDLLPDPSHDQLIATAFHRNTMTNSEGGTDDEEFRTAAVVDRINTTMAAWTGLTFACAQCHDHKYDPISQREYYEFMAVFNNTEDADRPDERPTLVTLGEKDLREKARLEAEIATLEQTIAEAAKVPDAPPPPPPTGALATRHVRVELPGKGRILSLAEVEVLDAEGRNLARKGKATQSSTAYAGPARLGIDGATDGDFDGAKTTTHTATERHPWWQVDLGGTHEIHRVVLWNRTDGKLHSRLNGARVVLLDDDGRPLWVGEIPRAPETSVTLTPPRHADALSPTDRAAIAARTAAVRALPDPRTTEIERLRKKITRLGDRTPILRELPADKRRRTHLLHRGSFLTPGEEVQPGVPAALHPWPEGVAVDRLSVARWLVSPDNPLAARVAVNRTWARLFGRGIVETAEDFGNQGSPPTHPGLLDHLANAFVADGQDLKRLIRRIVTSATYRQSSRVTPALLERDRFNALLARGPRFRLSGEAIRDQALAVSGLLSRKTHGPSVRPPRPNLGIRAAFGGSTDWKTSEGEDRYRRGLYTRWRRTTPYPSFTTFDAPSREFCTVRRIRTNTPLQALVTLNDPVFVEAAQALARWTLAHGGATDMERATAAFRRCLVRRPRPEEIERLVALRAEVAAGLADAPERARALASDPLGPLPDDADPVDLAAWTVVANVLMNLDEFLSRP